MLSGWISLLNWERFQHYKDRDPPWVKLYRDLLTSESWVLGSDLSRVIQTASIMLAPRYGNKIPYRFDLLKKVMSLDCTEAQFHKAIRHLHETKFLDIQEVPDEPKAPEQSASTPLATCASEKSREEQRRSEQKVPSEPVAQERDRGGDPVEKVFEHWKATHNHPKAQLDADRRKLIRRALTKYSEADLCQSISGYLNSPHHMGQNENGTVYDSLELFLRDSEHVDRGLKLYADPPRADLSAQTRRIIAATEDWQPPEMRRAAN